MQFLKNINVLTLMERTLNHIDKRLAGHGRRVAYIVYQLLWPTGRYTDEELRDICIAALLHDVGAYKTEEIERMVTFEPFETHDTWDHAIYGYLFLKYFSPIEHLAPVILHHHSGCGVLKLEDESAWLAQIFFIADRLDILTQSGIKDRAELLHIIDMQRDELFFGEVVDFVLQSSVWLPVWDSDVADGSKIYRMLHSIPLSDEASNKFLRMIVLLIDMRSHQTLTHTVATTAISAKLAEIFSIEEDEFESLVTGSWLHDIGKTGIPLHILEKATPLSYNEMETVRQHVTITDSILRGCVPDSARRIAAHHHEKLDGSGYPDGLEANQLRLAERIAVVADIFSALCGERSYKDEFPKEKVIGILNQMCEDNLLDADIVAACIENYDEIKRYADEQARPYEESFAQINKEFTQLRDQFSDNKES